MPNSIDQAVQGQEHAGIQRLRDTGRLGYRAATIQTDQTGDGLAQAFQQFTRSAGMAGAAYGDAMSTRADQRSNEIIRKLTPEQRKSALASNTLLYQDDPYTMAALAQKVGRNGAFDVDAEIQNKIQEGAFKTPDDLRTYRQTRLQDAAQTYADANGISVSDKHFQDGFNSHITERNAAIYDSHGQWLSARYKATAVTQTASDIGSVMADPSAMRDTGTPAKWAALIGQAQTNGGLTDDDMTAKVIGQTFSKYATAPGADTFFANIGDQEVNLYGKPTKVRDIVGPTVLENYQAQASAATFTRNRELQHNFDFGLQNAIHHPDPHKGLEMVNDLETKLKAVQPTGMDTPEWQKLTATRGQILGNLEQQNQQLSIQMTKAVQTDNRMATYQDRFNRKMAGENISTDPKTFETDQTHTGNFTPEDGANFANQTFKNIDRMDLPDAAKDQQKLKYLAADTENGPFRKLFEGVATGAQDQYKALVAADSAQITDATSGKIQKYLSYYKTDPATMASLYPEQAALAERALNMGAAGMGLDVMVDGDRKVRGATQQEQMLYDQKWNELLTGSGSSVPQIPGTLMGASRTLFNATLQRTGDERQAKTAVDDFLGKTTVTFGPPSNGLLGTPLLANDHAYVQGVIKKTSLMVDPGDAASWQKGRDIINAHVDALLKEKTWIDPKQVTLTDTPNGIMVQDALGAIKPLLIPVDLLRAEYQHNQSAAATQAAETHDQRADAKIGQYKAEQQRRASQPLQPLQKLDPSFGTIEGAAGYRDN